MLDSASALVVTGGQAYGLFGPRGGTWVRDGQRLVDDLHGRDYFSVAALPDDRPETFARFRRHAFVFVTGAEVSWQYDAAAAELRTTFSLATKPREPGETAALMALYPHQWKHLGRGLGAAKTCL